MSVRAEYAINGTAIEEMDLKISFTMRVSQWRALMREQNHTWPSCDVGRAIAGALGEISRATDRTYSDPKE